MKRLAIVLALILIGCVDDPPEMGEVDPAAADTLFEEPATSQAQQARSAGVAVDNGEVTKDELHEEIERLASENADLRLRLVETEAEVQQYKAGLEEAVEELNRVSSESARMQRYLEQAASSTPTRRTRSTPQPKARVSTLGPPQVQILGDQVVVTGHVYNNGDADARGSIVLTLMVDNRPVDDARVPLNVPAGTDQVYSYTFNFSFRNGTYSARIRLDY